MKLLLLILTLCLPLAGQKTNVEIAVQDDNATSELPFIQMAMRPGMKNVQFSAMYFGPKSESDVSFLLLLVGSKTPYDNKTTYAVRVLIDDVPLKADKARMVRSVKKETGGFLVSFHVTTEEVAWMATGSRLTFSLINTDDAVEKETDVAMFTPAGLTEFKKFAQSILLIRSRF